MYPMVSIEGMPHHRVMITGGTAIGTLTDSIPLIQNGAANRLLLERDTLHLHIKGGRVHLLPHILSTHISLLLTIPKAYLLTLLGITINQVRQVLILVPLDLLVLPLVMLDPRDLR